MQIPALASAFALVAVLAIPASAQDRTNALSNGVAPSAAADPQIMIYRIPGVNNTWDNSANGIATVFSCHNNSSVSEIIRIRIFNPNGLLSSDNSANIASKRTLTIATHYTIAFTSDFYTSIGVFVKQGTASIISTSREIFCSAMIVDAAASVPSGIALHMVRFNPAPGSVE